MRLAFWIASKNLASRRLQALCALLGVAFGVAAVCAVQVVDYNTVLGAQEYHRRNTGNPDCVLTIKDVRKLNAERAWQKLQRHDGVEVVTPVFEATILIEAEEAAPQGLPIMALDFQPAEAFDGWRLASGRVPSKSDEILLGAKAAEVLGLELDQELRLRRPGATVTGCVDGKIVPVGGPELPAGTPRTVRLAGTLEPRYLGSTQRGRMGIVPYELGLALLEGAPVATRFWARAKGDADLKDLVADLSKDFEVRIPHARTVAETPEERAFRSGVRLAAFLALGLGLFVIFHLVNLSVTTWVRQAGLLGALGMPARALGRVVFAEAAIVAGLGAVVGIGLGVLFAWLMFENHFTTLGWRRPLGEFSVPWHEIYWVPALGIIVSLLGAIQPVARIRAVSTLDAITQGEAALSRQPRVAPWVLPLFLALMPPAILGAASALRWVDADVLRVALSLAGVFALFILVLWGLPGLLVRALGVLLRPFESSSGATVWIARRNLSRSVRRFAASVTGLSLVASALVTLHALTGGLKSEIDAFAARAMPGHVYVHVPHQKASAVAPIFEGPEVQSALSIDASFRDGTLEFRGVPAAQLWREGALFERPADRIAFERGRGMILSRRAAWDAKLEVGEQYTVSPRGTPHAFRVLAISDEHGYFPEERAFALVAEDAMRHIFCVEAAVWSRVVVKAAKPGGEVAVKHAIRKRWNASGLAEGAQAPLRMQTAQQAREALRFEVSADFAIFDVILLLTGILGGLGLMNSLIVSGLERTRELGLLRAVGVSKRQVARLFLLEAGLVGLAGALLGVAMGIPFGWISVEGLAAMSELPLEWNPQLLWSAIAIVLITGVALLSAFVPARRAGRQDVIKAIKFE